MNVFLSCVSTEFKSYRLRLANQLGALKDHPYEIKVQEDFQHGGYTLLDQLADYVRQCDLVVHLAGDACGARPTAEHVQALYRSLGEAPPDPLPEWSYTQWEYRLALRFHPKMQVYLAAAEAPRDCPLPVQQSDDAARSQQAHIAAIKDGGKHYGTFTACQLGLDWEPESADAFAVLASASSDEGSLLRSPRPEPGLPADSLQSNSDLLQRNSNITETEFQQFQWLCDFSLHCSSQRLVAPRSASQR